MLVDRVSDAPSASATRCAAPLRDDWERIHVVPVDQRCLDRAAELGREPAAAHRRRRSTSPPPTACPARSPSSPSTPARSRSPWPWLDVISRTDRLHRRPALPARGRRALRRDGRPRQTGGMHAALADSRLEIHKVVVGPVRQQRVRAALQARPATPCCSTPPTSTSSCSTCARPSACARCSRPTATGTTSRPCRPMRDAGYEVARHRAGRRRCCRRYDEFLEDDVGHRGRPAAAAHDPHAGPHRRVDVLPASRARRSCSAATRCSPAARATPSSTAATSRRSSARSRTACSRTARRTRSCSPATATTPRSATERPHLQEWIDRGW